MVVAGVPDRDELFRVRFDALMRRGNKWTKQPARNVRRGLLLALALVTTWGVLRAQREPFKMPRPFREYPGYEYNNFPVPADYMDNHDWTRARLRYTSFLNVHGYVPDG